MLIEHHNFLRLTLANRITIQDRHSLSDRLNPCLFQHDYLAFKFLKQDLENLLALRVMPNTLFSPNFACLAKTRLTDE